MFHIYSHFLNVQIWMANLDMLDFPWKTDSGSDFQIFNWWDKLMSFQHWILNFPFYWIPFCVGIFLQVFYGKSQKKFNEKCSFSIIKIAILQKWFFLSTTSSGGKKLIFLFCVRSWNCNVLSEKNNVFKFENLVDENQNWSSPIF
jgi:hypothetical protein